ncbi:MAG TPA: hypothetical protein VG407_02260 [Caulobacteraceae bacterium]|jgi:hypothetical protein|nr:hypothetical protein [Caulobacteraceae bacterium]
MPTLPLRLTQGAAVAALALSGLAFSSGAAGAQPWTHVENHCSDYNVCATFRCNDDGDHCTRVSEWRAGAGADLDRSYYYRHSDGDSRWATEDHRTMERCTGNLCATYRCNIDGNDCIRLSGYSWR